MHIAICDDNKQDLLKLKNIIQEILNQYSICYNIKEYDSGEKLLMTPLEFHLIFLDIIMGGKNGIEIGKQIYRKNHSIKIIFQTNFGQYSSSKDAMNKSHAFAFLEKPIEKALVEEQIKEFIEGNEGTQEILAEFRNVRYTWNGMNREKTFLTIPVRDILYFEYMKSRKEITIVTEKGNSYIYSEAMNSLEKRMRPLGFETSCRGILVNLEKIIKIKGYSVLLNNGEDVPLSQRRVAEFKERVNEYIRRSLC